MKKYAAAGEILPLFMCEGNKMTDLLEALMVVCFGLSWPISIHKSWTSRTAKGKSLFFECFIWIGYVFGIVRKFLLYNEAAAAGTALGWLFYLSWVF